MLDFTYEGKRLFYFIGYRIDANKWIDCTVTPTGEKTKVQRVKKNAVNKDGVQYNQINTHIDRINSLVSNIYLVAKANKIFIDNDYLRINLNNELGEVKTPHINSSKSLFWDKWTEYMDTAKVSGGRKKQLKTTMNHLKRFCTQNQKKSISFDALSPKLIADFENYLLNDHPDKKEYEGLKKNRTPRQKSQNTATGNLKRFKAFINWCMKPENGTLIKENPFSRFSIKGEVYGVPITMTKAERDYLYSKEISSERLARVRDIFCFQCFVGCRVGDLLALTKNDIIDNVLIYYPNKTRKNMTPAKVPLSAKAKEILKKYENLESGMLLPFISSDKYNKYIKELFELAELNRPVTRLNPLTMKKEQVPLYETASSHLARRTFIHILHKNVKDSVIASMSGHSKDSQAFSRYYDIEDIERIEAIQTYLD